MTNRTEYWLQMVSKGMHRIGAYVCLPTLATIVSLDVVLRYIFNAPLSWAHELNGLLLLCVFMMSIVLCWYENKHIRMEVLYERFGNRMKEIADLIGKAIGCVVFGCISFSSFKEIPYIIRTNEIMRELPVPIWPFMMIVAMMSLLFCVSLVVECGVSIMALCGARVGNDRRR